MILTFAALYVLNHKKAMNLTQIGFGKTPLLRAVEQATFMQYEPMDTAGNE